MNEVRTITIVAVVGMLLLIIGGLPFDQKVLAKTGDSHTHCWKQRLYVYTNPVQPEDLLLCHTTTGAEENK